MMKTNHAIAADNFIAQLTLDTDCKVRRNDLGNDGVRIEVYTEINVYRDSDPIKYTVRQGLIYIKKPNGKKGRELFSYDSTGTLSPC